MANDNSTDSTIEIPLSLGQVTIIDAADFELVSRHKWHARKFKYTYYAATNLRQDDGTYKYLPMHRFLLDAPVGLEVDHIDGNGLNNCRANIRLATKLQNQHNQRLRGGTSSQYKGVYFSKAHGKWRAEIQFDDKRYGLGIYASEVEAALAYDAKAIELCGEFAWLNFPNGGVK